MGRPLTVAMLATLMTWPARAEAESIVTLDWRASAAECPDGSQVVGELERILGDGAGPRRHVAARADVTLTKAGTFRVTLVTTGADVAGRRTFEAETCRELASASALILAITVNPQLSSGPLEPAPPPNPEPTTPGSEAANDAPAPPTAPPALPDRSSATKAPAPYAPSGSRKHFGASVAFAGDIGSLPSADGGVEAALAWVGGSGERIRVEAAGRLFLSSKKEGSTNAGADFRSLGAGVRGGYALLKTDGAQVGPLLGVELDHIEAAGFGGTTSFDPNATFLCGSAGVLAVWSPFRGVPSFALRLSVEAVVPLERPEFVVREPAPTSATTVHQPAIVAGRAALGMEMFFF